MLLVYSGLQLDEAQQTGSLMSVPDALYMKGCVKNAQEGVQVCMYEEQEVF